jgi:hypothetical protein
VRTPEITEAFSSFELASRPECAAYGWDAWPLIRCWIALAQSKGRTAALHGRPSAMLAVPWGARSLTKAPGWALQTRGSGFKEVPTQQVAVITIANRTQFLGGKYYRYIAEPVVRTLARSGVTAATWEFDRPAQPTWHDAFSCDVPLYAGAAARQLSGRVRRIRKELLWFGDVSEWYREVFDSELCWDSLSWVLRSTEAMRQTYASWFRRAGTRLVLTDAWYGVPTMAAILGARSVGIPALDIQHGVQGAGHFAYSGWHATDYTTRMCPFPSGFWVWGSRDAEGLEKNNPGVLGRDNVFAAGSPWLNEWLDPLDEGILEGDAAAAKLVGDSVKVVLVTLQVREHIEEALDLVSRGPVDWLWLVRVHRGWREASAEVERKARERGLAQVVSVQATDLPLYALLRHADVHVTWWSTCALEATAFGVPTVLLDRVAESIYSDYISAGIMKLALQGDDALREIGSAASSEKADWRVAGEAFSAPAAAQLELERLLSTFRLSSQVSPQV